MRNATLTPLGTPAGYCPVPGLKAPKTPLAKMSLTPTGSVVNPVQSASVPSSLGSTLDSGPSGSFSVRTEASAPRIWRASAFRLHPRPTFRKSETVRILNPIYSRPGNLFQDADDRYNSGLCHFNGHSPERD